MENNMKQFTSVTKLYDIDNNVKTYVVVENGITSFVPLDEANTDYQAIQEWIAKGGVVIDNGGN
jgi:hypothetical protein